MNSTRTWVLGFSAGLVVLLLGAGLVVLGVVGIPGRDDSARPACATLPDRADVERAMIDNADLVRQIEGVGNVQVQVTTPCDDVSRALVGVRFESSSERDEVDRLLQEVDGFGVPVEVVRS